MNLKQITKTNWIVFDGDKKVGLLSYIKGEYILLKDGEQIQFETKDEVNDYYGEDVFEVMRSVRHEGITNINGFPVDYSDPIIIENERGLPLFKKMENSDVYYAAGHYCIKFERSWRDSYCPKIFTLERYEYKGPFRTFMEAKAVLRNLNTNARNKQTSPTS